MSNLVNQWVSLGLLKGAEMTQRQLIIRVYPSSVDSHKSFEPGAHCIACRQPNSLKSILSDSVCLTLFLVALFLRVFLVAWLV